MISYELILSSAILIVILLAGSFNFTTIIESQEAIWFVVPLLPVFIFYFISILAETSRTPFDLQEAESELVAGFFTEHSSIIFLSILNLYNRTLVQGLSQVLKINPLF